MSKSAVSESNDGHESNKTGGKRGAGDEGDDNEEGIFEVPPAEALGISITASMHT